MLLITKRYCMDTMKLLNADYLDIIYENRNKSYGGYELRKHYNQRAGRAMIFLFSSLGLLIFLSAINSHPVEHLNTSTKVFELTQVLPPDIPKVIPKIIPPTPPPAAAASTIAHTEMKIVPNDDPDPKPPTEISKIGDANPGKADVTRTTNGVGSDTKPGNGTETKIAVTLPPAKPLSWASVMPAFSGDLNAYISSHLKYPELAKENGIEGPVIVKFIVNEDGSVSDATIVRGIGGGCDEEALRMVRSMPHWKPGNQNGTPVKIYFTLPIRFVLN